MRRMYPQHVLDRCEDMQLVQCTPVVLKEGELQKIQSAAPQKAVNLVICIN
uniref:Uncharacterized protein n=1 Tax=Oryza brachyantha TaxID=4533 RepID=J3L7H4_ORYBR